MVQLKISIVTELPTTWTIVKVPKINPWNLSLAQQWFFGLPPGLFAKVRTCRLVEASPGAQTKAFTWRMTAAVEAVEAVVSLHWLHGLHGLAGRILWNHGVMAFRGGFRGGFRWWDLPIQRPGVGISGDLWMLIPHKNDGTSIIVLIHCRQSKEH